VTTIGQLYYSRKDHANLAHKMSTYFLEYIRTRLKVSTNRLDESFVQALHAKTGYPVEEIRSIVYFIQVTDTASVSEGQLNRFYQQLEIFIKIPKMETEVFGQRTDLTALSEAVIAVRQQIKKVIVGQDESGTIDHNCFAG
jgi:phosphoglycerate-specific signal transduction histidine kinase